MSGYFQWFAKLTFLFSESETLLLYCPDIFNIQANNEKQKKDGFILTEPREWVLWQTWGVKGAVV